MRLNFHSKASWNSCNLSSFALCFVPCSCSSIVVMLKHDDVNPFKKQNSQNTVNILFRTFLISAPPHFDNTMLYLSTLVSSTLVQLLLPWCCYHSSSFRHVLKTPRMEKMFMRTLFEHVSSSNFNSSLMLFMQLTMIGHLSDFCGMLSCYDVFFNID